MTYKEIDPHTARTKFYNGEQIVIETDGHKVIIESQDRIDHESGNRAIAWHKFVSGYAIQKNETKKIRFFEMQPCNNR